MKKSSAKRILAAIALSAAIPAVVTLPAKPAPAAELRVPYPIRVTSCDPQPGYVRYSGFVPGYYPASRYYWYDVYGYYYYQPPYATNPTLAIDYANATPRTISVVEFGLVAHRELIAEVRDVGTFSPNVTIKHEFGLNPNVFPLGTAMAQCVPLYVVFQDGTRWENPHLPALRRSMYPPE